MNADIEIQRLDRLRKYIVDTHGWNDPEDWTHRKFEEVSDLIFAKLHMRLSTNTLKRFFGKIATQSLPSPSTKDILARFAGFDSFTHFTNQCESSSENKIPAQHTNNRATKLSGKRHRLALLQWIVAPVIALIAVKFMFFPIRPPASPSGTLRVKSIHEGVPYTQTFYIATENVVSDSLTLRINARDFRIPASDSLFILQYFIPGFYLAQLFDDSTLLDSTAFHLTTDDWLLIYPVSSVEPRTYILLDTLSSGILSVSRQAMLRAGTELPPSNFHLYYFLVRDFEATGDNFSLSLSVRNTMESGGLTCPDVEIMIYCERGGYYFRIAQLGCAVFAAYGIGQTAYTGNETDLTALSVDLNQWQKLTIEAKNRMCYLKINDSLAFECPNNWVYGQIKGLEIGFRGFGETDWITLYDSERNVVYNEGFGNER